MAGVKLAPEQQEFFSNMETTFLSGGWELLSQGWKEERDALIGGAFFGAKSFEDVVAARIRYQLLSDLLSLPDTIEAQKQAILDPQEPESYV
jgi:hypothetical protein